MDGKHLNGSRNLPAYDGCRCCITAKPLLFCLFSSYDSVLQRPMKPLFFDLSCLLFLLFLLIILKLKKSYLFSKMAVMWLMLFSSILYCPVVNCRHPFTIVLFPSVVRNEFTLAGHTLPGWQRDCLALVSSATTPSIFSLSWYYHSK